MADSLLQKLEKLANQALLNCAKTQPTADKPPEYQWGHLQGKYAGLAEAVKVVAAWEEDEQTFEDNL
jgi:hypothetical protein